MLATPLTNPQEKPQSTKGLPELWVLGIFKKLQLRYPHKWDSGIEGIEKEMVKEWSGILSGLTGNDIKRGLKGWNENWPPSSVEFLKACKGQLKNEFGLNYVPQYYKQTAKERLIENDTHKKIKKETAEKYFKLMREKINKGTGA
ncbi:MAG: hypothetical protein BMS9Abin31_1207 [Gammaproteobacteria bacterium]|nr:MAG: hypothetical protein BMS9Abin31_1207 [Gammaproteobacteria bacterium]